jgi:type II secretory pathway pseudopilin PulG
MLVVIFIIGVLMSLMIAGLYQAMQIVKQRAVITEMANLTSAMQSYKSEAYGYPPCLGDALLANRQNRFTTHLRMAFPRYTGAYANAKSSLNSYKVNAGNGTGTYVVLNLDTLDQAEALVFWLAGPPTPVDSNNIPMSSRKVFGFHNNPTNPFQLDITNMQASASATQVATLNRMNPGKYYDFDDTRLVDNDGDGWLEFTPRGIDAAQSYVAPYVYFDAGVYTLNSWARSTNPTAANPIPPYIGYPWPDNAYPNPYKGNMSAMQSELGLAVPYASATNQTMLQSNSWTNVGTMPIQWQNPLNFQIICGGFDGQYSAAGTSTMRVAAVPAGLVFTGGGFSNQAGYDDNETDNLTNFSDMAIGNAIQSQ